MHQRTTLPAMTAGATSSLARSSRVLLLGAVALAGYVSGHGWLFTNVTYEHRVNNFFDALEAKDYAKAYGIYYDDPDWQQHPGKYSGYPLARFTDDWTTDSPINGPITSHHVDKSVSAGSGYFGTGDHRRRHRQRRPQDLYVRESCRQDHDLAGSVCLQVLSAGTR